MARDSLPKSYFLVSAGLWLSPAATVTTTPTVATNLSCLLSVDIGFAGEKGNRGGCSFQRLTRPTSRDKLYMNSGRFLGKATGESECWLFFVAVAGEIQSLSLVSPD